MPSITAASTITCASTAGTNDGFWVVWNNNYVECSNATSAGVLYYDCGTTAGTWQAWNTAVEEPSTPEVEARAEALLRSFLTPEQEQSWERESHFDVMVEGGDRPARHYRIKRGTVGNIKRLEGGRIVESLCVHPTRIPGPDANLAQMLHLLHDEDGLRRKANITPVAA